MYSYSELQNKCGIEDAQMKQCMLKLCNPKTGILIKENRKSQQFGANEKIQINVAFSAAVIKINFIPKLTSKEIIQGDQGKDDMTKLDGEVMKERSLVIDAAVVRIMKTCKVLFYTQLVQMVLD